jgi:hypothetical protein
MLEQNRDQKYPRGKQLSIPAKHQGGAILGGERSKKIKGNPEREL